MKNAILEKVRIIKDVFGDFFQIHQNNSENELLQSQIETATKLEKEGEVLLSSKSFLRKIMILNFKGAEVFMTFVPTKHQSVFEVTLDINIKSVLLEDYNTLVALQGLKLGVAIISESLVSSLNILGRDMEYIPA